MSGYSHNREPQVQKMKVQGSVLIRPPKLGTSSHFSTTTSPQWQTRLDTHWATGLRKLQLSLNKYPKGHGMAVTTLSLQLVSVLCAQTSQHPCHDSSVPAWCPHCASSLLQKGRSPPEPGASLMNFWPDMKSSQEC